MSLLEYAVSCMVHRLYLRLNLPRWGWFTLAGGVQRRMVVNNRCRGWWSILSFNDSSSSMRRSRSCSSSRSRCRGRDQRLRWGGGYTCRRRVSDIGEQRVLLSWVQRSDQLRARWRRGWILDLLASMFGVSSLILKVVHSLHEERTENKMHFFLVLLWVQVKWPKQCNTSKCTNLKGLPVEETCLQWDYQVKHLIVCMRSRCAPLSPTRQSWYLKTNSP